MLFTVRAAIQNIKTSGLRRRRIIEDVDAHVLCIKKTVQLARI